MYNFRYKSFPSSWYQIAWSAEIPAGEAVPMRYFEQDLAAYRGLDGVVHVSDAFCPHLGAHLGFGGVVEEGGIRCPFHGWKWGPDGKNVDIPYSPPYQMKLRLRQWEVRELNGVIFMWYGANGEQPDWEPEPLIWPTGPDVEYWDIYPDTTHAWPGVRFNPQVVTENSCDAAHFRYVHHAADVPDLNVFEAAGPVFHSNFEMEFGGGKQSTWATPEGPVKGRIRNRAFGLGYVSTEFQSFDRVYTLTATTPIDREHSDHRATVWVPKVRGDGSVLDAGLRDRWTRQQFSQHQADFPVWENMTYIARPPYAHKEAASFRALRTWCRQFYVAEELVS
jgi:3-ketosteroid 9alpha-monooxygenase subunit A